MKKLIIIGNQMDLDKDYSNEVNTADYVIRFNKIDNYNKKTGNKIDELVCRYSNNRNILHGFNEKNNFLHKINFNNIKLTVIFNSFNEFNGLNLINNIAKSNQIKNLNIIYNNICNSYQNIAETTMASTGKIMLEYIIQNNLFNDYDIYILGFNWFNLKKDTGHLWLLEKKQINLYIKNKIIKKM